MKAKFTTRSRRTVKAIQLAKKLPVIHPHAAGIDVGATEHSACVPPNEILRERYGLYPLPTHAAWT